MGCGASTESKKETDIDIDISLAPPKAGTLGARLTDTSSETSGYAEPIKRVETIETALLEVDQSTQDSALSRNTASPSPEAVATSMAVPEKQDAGYVRKKMSLPRTRTVDSYTKYAAPSQTLIFLDWDDTIFPTTELFDNWKLSDNMSLWEQETAKLSAQQRQQLEQWETAAFQYLEVAMALTESLVIVTNARHPWVPACVKHFCPRLGQLLTPAAGGTLPVEEGGIRVVYTRGVEDRGFMNQNTNSRNPRKMIEALTALKYRAMRREAVNFYKQYPDQTWKNILSVGDSIYEHDAVLQIASRRHSSANEKLRAKAFLLLSEPPIAKLTLGLTVGRLLLPKLVEWDGNLDLDLSVVQDWDQAATASEDDLLKKLFGGDYVAEEAGKSDEDFTHAVESRIGRNSQSSLSLLDALWHKAVSCKPRSSRRQGMQPFRCASVVIQDEDADAKLAIAEMCSALGGEPSLVLIHSPAPDRFEASISSLTAYAGGFPGSTVHGCTSFHSVLSNSKLHSGAGGCLFGIRDPAGCYTSAARQVEGEGSAAWKEAAAAASKDALAAVGISSHEEDELPLVFLHATPGFEEAVLQGVAEVLPGANVLGGSAAHVELDASNWKVAADGKMYSAGAVAVALLWPSVPYSLNLSCVHDASSDGKRAVVTGTKKDGRRIVTLDGEPAADVYRRWLQEVGTHEASSGESLHPPSDRPEMEGVTTMLTTLYPLARSSVDENGGHHYFPIHPSSRLYDDGSLGVYVRARDGEELVLLRGSREGILQRMRETASSARNDILAGGGNIAGALVIGCAGLVDYLHQAGTLHDAIRELYSAIDTVEPGQAKPPLHGFWAYGEQGPLMSSVETCQATLMLNFLVFYNPV
eukprot:TRINITY_DN42843_c0_g1_i1.p1 TRINITY_DN42843_c0_g1~~TRINITY_DN42843_c0_g1_i1.p1  ORF type:complete len:882 (-),score=147.18 TRINITY_DN42843_c0_g1_i1:94-2691(-)